MPCWDVDHMTDMCDQPRGKGAHIRGNPFIMIIRRKIVKNTFFISFECKCSALQYSIITKSCAEHPFPSSGHM